MKCADLPRRLFQAPPTASHRRPRRHRPAFEGFEDKLLLSAFYVAPGGSNSADGSALHPWATIQHAADAVAPGDTVHVAPGRYNAPVSTHTSGTAAARITFISDVPQGAKIDTTGSSAETIWSNNADYVTIQGFDITSGNANCRIGIDNENNYVYIIGNHVHDIPATNWLSSSSGGGGITSGNYAPWGGLAPGTATQGNRIIGNHVNNIGPQSHNSLVQGIYVRDANCIVSNNISNNNSGVGIHLYHGATNDTISNNLVFMNFNGGILIASAELATPVPSDHCVVSNNIVINNPSPSNAGIWEEYDTGPNNVYLNNCVYGNSNAQIIVRTGHAPTGTVTSDARFVNYKSDGTGDYHLTSGSPDIGAGTSLGAPATDYAGVARPQGAGVDIGPYEYQTGPVTTPPTVTSESPASNATAVPISTTVTATFNESVQASSITPSTFVLKGSGGNTVSASVAYNSSTNTATLTPSAPLAASTTYTAMVSGAKDLSGNTMTGPFSWSFTTTAAAHTNATIWGSTATPAVPASTDTKAVELGVKLRSDVNGYITGIRYYKGSGSTGTHVGHLWTSTGTLLATATFSNETASGWQQVNFATPVAITAGTTYVASYYAPAGHYAYDYNYFASSGMDNGVLHALSNSAGGGNGVYKYASGGGFPTNTWSSGANYWVDIVFSNTLS